MESLLKTAVESVDACLELRSLVLKLMRDLPQQPSAGPTVICECQAN